MTTRNLPEVATREEWLVAVSRGPYDKIAAFRDRMGWTFPRYSSAGSGYLDLTALGRQDEWKEARGPAVPLGLHASRPSVRLSDECDA